MDRKDSNNMITDWITEPAYSPEDATAKFRWWCANHGVTKAYANVSIRERELIPANVRVDIATFFANVNAAPVKAEDLVTRVIKWCEQNVFAEVTTRKLAEEMGCSQHVARRIISDLPNYFRRLNQYKYEVRDYNIDKAHDRRTA